MCFLVASHHSPNYPKVRGKKSTILITLAEPISRILELGVGKLSSQVANISHVRLKMSFQKIKVANPVVDLDGDEMTRFVFLFPSFTSTRLTLFYFKNHLGCYQEEGLHYFISLCLFLTVFSAHPTLP